MIKYNIAPEVEALAEAVIDAAFKVHKTLGPGLLESVYQTCLSYELSMRKIAHQNQVILPGRYGGIEIESGLRLDVLIDEKIILELKSVERMIPLYEAQLLTYLKLTGLKLGFLINFNVPLFKDGIKRMVL